MIERIYRCDICKDDFTNKRNCLISVYFQNLNHLVVDKTGNSERHLCKRCLYDIWSIGESENIKKIHFL